MRPERRSGLGRAAELLARARLDVAVIPEIPADIRLRAPAESSMIDDVDALFLSCANMLTVPLLADLQGAAR